ncbi:ROK family transcriptional regulator [Nonomuraea longispora]|uniref:ROK family transcriptional regulator n=1 Tax=Nonomuraea longispora TaxID=1848320 RepID=A0A4R4NE97_9ACTN|nr:ROK family transcriptional regulator [Nonomuraea longispora]TDC07279.1 ROK family transcriptional regulator [Nonomuraea longispora]
MSTTRRQSTAPSTSRTRVDEGEVMAVTLAGPPAPARTWSARALAGHFGIPHATVSGVWRRWGYGPGENGPATVPADPPCPGERAELLGVWAKGGEAVLILGQAARPARGSRGRAADADERRSIHASLAAELERVQDTLASHAEIQPGKDGGDGPAAFIAAMADRHPDAELHVITWGEPAEPADAGPRQVVWHRALPAMSWHGTACAVALAELAEFPGRMRPVLSAFSGAAQEYAESSTGSAFTWLRWEPAVPQAHPAPRAFNQLALGSYNEKLVIESIRQAVALSRVEIAEQTGLTPQAVSRITRNLLTSGLLAEDERQLGGAGKPRVPLRLRPDAASAVGVHLDPEMITVVAVDLSGDVLDQRQMPLAGRRDPWWCIDQMTRLTLEAAEAAGPASEAPLGVGVAVPGPLDTRAEIFLDPPLFKGWEGVALRAELADRLDTTVIMEKDSTAAAIGERWLGAADRAGDFVYLYLGTGAGSGAFLNGDIYRGTTGNAGEVGSLCAINTGSMTTQGGPGSVPECAPMSAVVDRAMTAGLVVPQGDGAYEWVCAAAARGDVRAVGVLEEVAGVLGLGAVGFIDLLDVDLIIVGGPAVLPPVAEIYRREISAAVNRFPLARHVREVHVAQSRLNEAAAAVGAASSVFHEAFTPSLNSRVRSAPRT